MKIIQKFIKAKEGVASVEFAIWLTLLIPVGLLSLDFAIYNMKQLQLDTAVGEAAAVAIQSRKNINSSQIEQIVLASWDDESSSPIVTAKCNGLSSCVNTDRSCACVTGYQNEEPVFTDRVCGNLCPNGSVSGYYLTLNVRTNFNPVFGTYIKPPATNRTTLTMKID